MSKPLCKWRLALLVSFPGQQSDAVDFPRHKEERIDAAYNGQKASPRTRPSRHLPVQRRSAFEILPSARRGIQTTKLDEVQVQFLWLASAA